MRPAACSSEPLSRRVPAEHPPSAVRAPSARCLAYRGLSLGWRLWARPSPPFPPSASHPSQARRPRIRSVRPKAQVRPASRIRKIHENLVQAPERMCLRNCRLMSLHLRNRRLSRRQAFRSSACRTWRHPQRQPRSQSATTIAAIRGTSGSFAAAGASTVVSPALTSVEEAIVS